MKFPDDLCIGDVLLYHGTSLFNRITDLKTGGLVDHVEIYVGDGKTVAARPEGFNLYDFRPEGLAQVRRLTIPFDKDAADVWFEHVRGVEYDTPGLLQFFNIDESNNGFICSVGGAYYLRMGHALLFADDCDWNKLSPRDFQIVREAIAIWNRPKNFPNEL
jgi:hypothetical protein